MTPRTPYDIDQVRQDFPILARTVYDKPLIYLDNAATTQKPRAVIDAISHQYRQVNANVHRGVHYLSQQATELHEAARRRAAAFIHAPDPAEVIFTRGTTESINLVAHSFSQAFMNEGDEVIISAMEHHANIVPWQLVAKQRGIVLRVIPMDADGRLDLDAYERLFTPRTKLVSVVHVSNVLGTVNPIRHMAAIAHAHRVPIFVDGAQSVPHMPIDVQALGIDFFAFSAHKVYGPTGLGILWGKRALLDAMPPYQGGGEMISRVSFSHTTFAELPFKFEAGTPDYVAAHALTCALDYVEALGLDRIAAHESHLLRHTAALLRDVPGIRFFGQTSDKDAVISFLIDGIHPLDMGTLLDRLGIAVRTGHHCAQPIMDFYGVEGMLRASFALYNTQAEAEAFVEAVHRVRRMF